MKKSLIALAALATVATAAQAQSSVTLSGRIDESIQSTSGKNAGTETALGSSRLTTSRFQIDAVEDLGGGMKAIARLEAEINANTGAANANLFDRNAYVGLSGSLGTIQLGRNTTSVYDLALQYSPTRYSNTLEQVSAGTRNSLQGFTTANNANASRFDNSIKYSNTVNGFDIGASYALGGNAGDAQAGSTYNITLAYDAKVAKVGAGYSEYNRDTVSSSGVTTAVGKTKISTAGIAIPVNANTSVRAGWTNTKIGNATSDTGILDVDVYGIGVSYKVTPATEVTAAYYRKDAKGTAAGLAASTAAGQKTDTYGLQAIYSLSKTTQLYAQAVTQSNKDNVVFSSTLKDRVSQVNAGLVKFF
jgi:predicted porin